MAITLTHKFSGSDTTTFTPATTASLTAVANEPVYCVVVTACTTGSGTIVSGSTTVSGGGITWTALGSPLVYAARRVFQVFRGKGATPSAGALSISSDILMGSGVTELAWIVVQAEGVDATTPEGTVYTTAYDAVSGPDILTVTVSETPDAGDWVFGAFANQDSAGAMTISAELTAELSELTGLTDVRNLAAYYNSSPDSSPAPAVENTGTGAMEAGIAFIINAAAATGAPRQMMHHLQMMRG